MGKIKDEKSPENEGLPHTFGILPYDDPRVILFLLSIIPGLALIVYLPQYLGNIGLVIAVLLTFVYMLVVINLFYKWFRRHEKS